MTTHQHPKSPNILTVFFNKLKRFVMRENPVNNPLSPVQGSEVVDKEGVDVVLQRMAVIGLFDTIQSIAAAAKGSVNGLTTNSTKLPSSLLRVFINGIINACVLVEEVIEREEAAAAAPPQQPVVVVDPGPELSVEGGSDTAEPAGEDAEFGDSGDDGNGEETSDPETEPQQDQEEFDAILRSFGALPKKGQA